MARDTQTVEPQTRQSAGKRAKKKPAEPATKEERKNVLDAALAILEKRRGKTAGDKPEAETKPKRKRRAAASRPTAKAKARPASVPDLPLPDEAAPNGLPKPREVKLKGRLFANKPLNPKTKAISTEPEVKKASTPEMKKRPAARKKSDTALSRKEGDAFPTEIVSSTTADEKKESETLARMKEEKLKREYERKISSEREARMRAEARARVDDTARKIIKAEREEKRRIKDELESKLKMETEAKSAIIKELDGLKREMAFLRTGTTERRKAESEIMQLRRMLADKDRDIFRYKKQIDERADKKITAIIETIQNRKAPRTIPEPAGELEAVVDEEITPEKIISKTDSVLGVIADIGDRNPIFDGLPTLEIEKEEAEKTPAPAAAPDAAKPFNRIAHYLSTSRKKSGRYRQALLVSLPIAFLLLVVLGARAFFSTPPVDIAVETPAAEEGLVPVGEMASEQSETEYTPPAAIPAWNQQPESESPQDQAGTPDTPAETGFREFTPPVEVEIAEPVAPAPVVEDKIYKVRPGDSLWVICKKFYGSGIYHSSLSQYNNLKKGQLLRIGLELKIPEKDVLLSKNGSAH